MPISRCASALVSNSIATAFQASLIPPTPSRHDLNNFELSFDKLLAYWDSASALKKEYNDFKIIEISDLHSQCSGVGANTGTLNTKVLHDFVILI